MLFLSNTVTLDLSTLELDWKAVMLRLLCAMLVGLVIGTEREYTHRPAGMRTHMLVALGACSVMITAQMIFLQYYPYGSDADPARLGAQVIAGVGFLGAGTIIREGANVKGLTTAASVWAVACLGLACGAGYFSIALMGMLFLFVTLTIFELLQHKLITPRNNEQAYTLETGDAAAVLTLLYTLAETHHGHIVDMQADNIIDGCRISLRIQFARGKKHARKFFDALASAPEIRSAKLLEDGVQVHG